MPEIQGMRALAVTLVVLFHLWPQRLSGGFVGVDVFFVISGYLITSHLMREVDRTGSVRLRTFYARRARRLLPASLLVLAFSAVASALILPAQLARAALREVIASTVYVENVWLASKAVTYSASNDTASPVQHYWSLSTEEQFYALWPALILGAVALQRWVSRTRPRRALGDSNPAVGVGVALMILAGASFVHSVMLTSADPAAAYFVTTTRVWEFALGALTSLIARRWTPTPWLAVVLRWSGLAAIVVAACLLSQATPYPGALALIPVVGTAAAILAADGCPRDPVIGLSSLRPVQWLGDVSYAVYLWHWPLIALAPIALGRDLSWPDKLVVVVVTALLADMTRRWVERPFLTGLPALTGTPWRTLLSALVAMTLIAGACAGYSAWSVHADREALKERLLRMEADPCMGASATVNPDQCGSPFTRALQAPASEADSPWDMPHCDPFCEKEQRNPRVIAVVGDSHAQTLYKGLLPLAEARGYQLAFFLKGGCPLNTVGSDLWHTTPRPAQGCGEWSRSTLRDILDLRPSLVITSAYVGGGWSDPDAAAQGYLDTWGQITSLAPLVVVRDYPGTGGVWGPECLAKHPHDTDACAVPRAEALPRDVAYETAAHAGPRVSRLDFSDVYCDTERCYPVVGGLPVYWDADHITGTFARSLAPLLAERLDLP